MVFVGIDVAKSKHDCCFIDSDGVIYNDSLRIPNSKKGFDTLYSTILSALGTKDLINVKIGLESTGHYMRRAVMQAARLVSMRDATFASYMEKKRSEVKYFNVI